MSAEHASTALRPAQFPESSAHVQTTVAVEDIGTGHVGEGLQSQLPYHSQANS